MKITCSELIQASQAEVFNVFSDIEHVEERIEGIKSLEVLSETKTGLGLRWRETRVMFGKEATEEMEITGFDEPRAYVVEAESHGMHYTSRYTFDPAEDSGTKVTWEFEGQPLTVLARLMTPLGWLFKGVTKAALKKDVLDLKRYLEASTE